MAACLLRCSVPLPGPACSTVTAAEPAGSQSASQALLARRRAQSAVAREDIPSTPVARAQFKPETGSLEPLGQHSPAARGGLSHADCQSAPTCSSVPPAQASQLPQCTQYPGQADRQVAGMGSAARACHPLPPAQVPPITSVAAYWQQTAGPQQAACALAAPALDWRGGSQEMAATQLQCSPMQEPQAGAACGAPSRPSQQAHGVGPSATYLHVDNLEAHGVCGQQWAATAPLRSERAATDGMLCCGSCVAPATPPRLVRPPPLAPVSPPGSYGARLADQLRQATTLLRVHGGPAGDACRSPHTNGAVDAGGAAAEGGGLGEPALEQHGLSSSGAAQDGGSGAGGCAAVQQDRRRSGLHDGPLVSGARPGVLHGQPQGSVQVPTPPHKRARTKAQRLRQRQEQDGAEGLTAEASLHGLGEDSAGAVDIEGDGDIQLVSISPATHELPHAAMDVIDLCGD